MGTSGDQRRVKGGLFSGKGGGGDASCVQYLTGKRAPDLENF